MEALRWIQNEESSPSTETPLNSRGHPFFQSIPYIFKKLKAFHDSLSLKGTSLSVVRLGIPQEAFSRRTLSGHSKLEILIFWKFLKCCFGSGRHGQCGSKNGIKVGWIDQVLLEIGAKRDHCTLLREARLLRVQLEKLHEELDKVGQQLMELDTEMLYKNFTSHSIANFKIQTVRVSL